MDALTEPPPVTDDDRANDRRLDVIVRTGDDLLDAIIDFGEHSFQHGCAVEAQDWDRVSAENRRAVGALGRVQKLLRSRGLTSP